MNSEFYPESLKNCHCSKEHNFPLKEIISKNGVINTLPELLKKYGKNKPFLVFDKNTYKAAGEKIISVLKKSGIKYSFHLFKEDIIEPDEKFSGVLLINFDTSCDCVLGVGSGVINDLCKILAAKTDRFYMIVATAPSMDGYASATSSMAVSGLKVTVNSKCPEVIIGDIDILKNAPLKALKSGLGDMIAKYVSIAEWRISHEINDEYYCETIAQMIKGARDKCVKNAKGLLDRNEKAVKAVFDGLIIGGIAMAYAGVSRPASGVEHYISHLLDMRALEFNVKAETHGIQCAIATFAVAKLYDRLKTVTVSEEKGYKNTRSFDKEKWKKELKKFVGRSAEVMIELEEKENKFSAEQADKRRKTIIEKWDKIIDIINEELPSAKEIEKILDTAKIPKSLKEAKISADSKMLFKSTADIRDKYVLSRLLFDIGELDDFSKNIKI